MAYSITATPLRRSLEHLAFAEKTFRFHPIVAKKAEKMILKRIEVQEICDIALIVFKKVDELMHISCVNSITLAEMEIEEFVLRFDAFELVYNIMTKWTELYYQAFGALQLIGPFAFNEDDFIIMKKEEIWEDYNDLIIGQCQDFVFYMLNEENAYPYLFTTRNNWPKEMHSEPISFFAKWGYQLTSTPKIGDLVIYCHEGVKGLSVRHFGLFDGSIVSKFGNRPVYRHSIEDVPLSFGTRVLILHKPIPCTILKELLIKFENSSLNPSDILKCMHVQKVFKRCLYNEDYNLRLKEAILKKLESSELTDIQKAVLQVIEEVPLTFNFSTL